MEEESRLTPPFGVLVVSPSGGQFRLTTEILRPCLVRGGFGLGLGKDGLNLRLLLRMWVLGFVLLIC